MKGANVFRIVKICGDWRRSWPEANAAKVHDADADALAQELFNRRLCPIATNTNRDFFYNNVIYTT